MALALHHRWQRRSLETRLLVPAAVMIIVERPAASRLPPQQHQTTS